MDKKILKIMWVISLVIICILAFVIANHAFNIVTLPEDLFKCVALPNVMALMGYLYTDNKLKK